MRVMPISTVLPAVLLATVCACAAVRPAPVARPTLNDRIDAETRSVLEATGTPSASVAVVRDGILVHAQAIGLARLNPAIRAEPTLRYRIGSISKQFTAAALLLLQEDGALSLDDRVSRYFPDLGGTADVTIRELLSHTGGVRDYWPHDYVPPAMTRATSPDELLGQWASRSPDFEPGTDWQYSNTGYVLAGRIAEVVSGRPLFNLLQERIFQPLGMKSVQDADEGRDPSGPEGYTQSGLGPFRVAPAEGKGWLFGAGGLAMTAADLARWDMAMMSGELLRPESWKALSTETRLSNGVSTEYGLGVVVKWVSGRRVIGHPGEVSGFTSTNRVYPDDGAAVVVLVNADSGNAAATISERIAKLLLVDESPKVAQQLARARAVFAGLQQGRVDRSMLTPNAAAYFTAEVLDDLQRSLAPLGALKDLQQTGTERRGGMELRWFKATLAKRSLEISQLELPDGRLEQFLVHPD